MKKKLLSCLMIAISIVLLSGCVTRALMPPGDVNWKAIPKWELKSIQEGKFPYDYDKVFDAVKQVLSEQGWPIDRANKEAGEIDTGDSFGGRGIICTIDNNGSVSWEYYTVWSESNYLGTFGNMMEYEVTTYTDKDYMPTDEKHKWNLLVYNKLTNNREVEDNSESVGSDYADAFFVDEPFYFMGLGARAFFPSSAKLNLSYYPPEENLNYWENNLSINSLSSLGASNFQSFYIGFGEYVNKFRLQMGFTNMYRSGLNYTFQSGQATDFWGDIYNTYDKIFKVDNWEWDFSADYMFFTLERRLSPYIGAGLSVGQWDIYAEQSDIDSITYWGAFVNAGVAMHIRNFLLDFQVRESIPTGSNVPGTSVTLSAAWTFPY